MANPDLFKSTRGALVPPADAVNEAGGNAYALSPKHALAQYAVTGCLSNTFYASAEEQLDTILSLAQQCEPGFIAKLAVFSRQSAYMKDSPALLCAWLATTDVRLLERVFDRVIDNGRMLRNFAQIIRSGVVGRKSFGTAPRRLIRRWIERRSPEQLLRDSVGESPSLADIIKMVHVKPADSERAALYAYLVNTRRGVDVARLPASVQAFEAWKADKSGPLPPVDFRLLTALDLGPKEWIAIARNAGWTMTRMNLNTFVRHGVFEDGATTKLVAARLADPNEVRRARAFPYQLMAAFLNADKAVPRVVTNALQDAMEVATENVPETRGDVFVLPDVSGSMASPVTGRRAGGGGGTSKMRCIDVAALTAACILRKNPDAQVMPFAQGVVDLPRLNARDSILTNAEKLAKLLGGGTNCSAPLLAIEKKRAHVDAAIFVSDNESWMDTANRGTGMMQVWSAIVQRDPEAKLVCIDIQPYGTSQAPEGKNRLNVGGFSDTVFQVVGDFLNEAPGRFVERIESVEV